MMSDGDIPPSLKGKQYSYRATGVIKPRVSGTYTLSVATTGKTKVFFEGKLLIDNTEWTEVATSNGFLGCSSPDKTAVIELKATCPYKLSVENLVTLPPNQHLDNTLFPYVSGLRLGLALHENEQEMFDRSVEAACRSGVAVVVVGHNKDSEGEGGDRASLNLPGRTNDLMSAICAANPNTAFVVQSSSAVSMPWVEQARAIVLGWYQGQENGNTLADVLLGKCNFSGKTPITFLRQLSDHGSSKWHPAEAAQDRSVIGEKVLIGYRSFEEREVAPLWPFGFGLSYTSFSLSGIRLDGQMTTSVDSMIVINACLSNDGEHDGHEAVQVYISPSTQIRAKGLESYPKTLAGFIKSWVPAGEMRDVQITVRSEELRWYDEEVGSWMLDRGTYSCFVGTSAASIDKKMSFEVI
ncbi:glycosyl hydrolase [Penicillium hordei]|uniref:beta-glucosidase n=1 Tax=Penicillium hordei TaxID=40994 RepID=A0AAD6E0W9_9EURO|nr:glycosyl hydrolase [Penicillium hordei]KAJ5598582.1 glycosyl hydrolase [Penicillium hordei]